MSPHLEPIKLASRPGILWNSFSVALSSEPNVMSARSVWAGNHFWSVMIVDYGKFYLINTVVMLTKLVL